MKTLVPDVRDPVYRPVRCHLHRTVGRLDRLDPRRSVLRHLCRIIRRLVRHPICRHVILFVIPFVIVLFLFLFFSCVLGFLKFSQLVSTLYICF